MRFPLRLTGLVAAPHTPMHADGSLNAKAIPAQSQLLLEAGVRGAFICGTTGESLSLTVAERMAIAENWKEAAAGKMPVVVHVGSNSLPDARALATHAAKCKVDAIAVMAPSFFKPNVDDLIAYCAAIAAGVAGADRGGMVEAAVANSRGPARDAVKRGAAGRVPEDFFTHQGWVSLALQNAFQKLLHAKNFEEALVETISYGGDTDTNAAIAGALLGSFHSRDGIPARWIFPLLACRPLAECGALRPRPAEYWPDDVLELAEALLA